MYAGIVYCEYSKMFMIRILVKYTSLFVHQQVTFTFSLSENSYTISVLSLYQLR